MNQVLAILATLLCLGLVLSCLWLIPILIPAEESSTEPETPAVEVPAAGEVGQTWYEQGMKITRIKEGAGEPAKPGTKVNMHYTGWTDGFNGNAKFDSSLDRGTPFSFVIGTGQVIKGWDIGVPGMLPGEKRQLKIPSDLGYGERGSGAKIPPGATLFFEVEYVGPAN